MTFKNDKYIIIAYKGDNMKIRVPIRLLSFSLSSLLGINFGCTPKKVENKSEELISEPVIEDTKLLNEETPIIIVETPSTAENTPEPTSEPLISEEIDESELDFIEESYYVTALENTNIYENKDSRSEKLTILPKGESLPFIKEKDGGWYEVKYDGKSAYAKSDNLEIVESLTYPKQDIIPVINFADEIFLHVEGSCVVKATGKVNIREGMTTESEKLGQLSKGETLPFIKEHDEWYEVNYGGRSAFVYKEYAKVDSDLHMNHEMYDMVLATRKTPLIDAISGEEIMSIPKREVAEVYAQTDEYFLVKCNGKIGYMNKEYAQSLGDTYVIIDISSQHLKSYVDDKLVVETDIVTGQDSSPTYCGIFAVREKKRKVHWPEFGVTVKYWMPFNRGEGMHDASWRKKFGGTIYHKDGSHGCVNIPPKVMPKIYENADVGTLVLVKK